MSRVAIAGNVSGTGVFTLESPNSNTNRTLVLPDEAGTIITTAGVPASALPAGSVLQVVQGTLAGDLGASSTSSTSYIDTGLSASITPSASGNKILVLVSYKPKVQAPTGNDLLAYANLNENGTSIEELRLQDDNLGKLGDTVYKSMHIPMSVLRTTSSTATLTYKIQAAAGNAGVYYYKFEDSTITLLEIAA